jgi:tetratricopeptide (TPR) repeat protein
MSEAPGPAAIVQDVTALLQRQEIDKAIALAKDALDRGFEAPLLLNLRAYWLEGQNRPTDALADLRRARELAPQDPMVLNALGLCLAKLGRTDEAYLAFRQCAELAPEFGPAHFNCGWTLEELGELDRARQAFEEAARLDPEGPNPYGRLAALAARRAQWDTARAHAQTALARAPDHPAAVIALAQADFAAKSYGDAKIRLQIVIDTPQASVQDRGTAAGVLGDILDAQGRYHDAFAAYTAGNALFKNAFTEKLAMTSEMSMADYVRWLLDSFGAPSMPSWSAGDLSRCGPGEGPSRHVFLLGFARSGTTLLEEVLACHPDAVTTGERDPFTPLVRELLAQPAQLERLRDLGPAAVARNRTRYWQALGSLGIPVEGKLLIDKQPLNTVRLPLIAKLFPDAKIVFCLRDPRDVVLSCFRRRFINNPTNFEFLTLDGAARLYDAILRLASVYREKLPLDMHEIRNEDVVDDFDGEIGALCAFLGIDWTDAFRDFARRSGAREVTTPSATQVVRGLGREGIGHWRHYRAEMEPVLPLWNAWAERLNYPDN